MDFTIHQTFRAGLDAVEERLADADVIAACSALRPLADCRLLDARRDGARWELRIHRRFAADLPAVVTAVVDPRRLTWVEEVSYDPTRRAGAHRIVPDHYRDLLQCRYETVLRADGDATVHEAPGTLRVRTLLGARTVERAIVGGLAEYAAAEAELVGTWPADGVAGP